jgi:hypothetical protein
MLVRSRKSSLLALFISEAVLGIPLDRKLASGDHGSELPVSMDLHRRVAAAPLDGLEHPFGVAGS